MYPVGLIGLASDVEFDRESENCVFFSCILMNIHENNIAISYIDLLRRVPRSDDATAAGGWGILDSGA